MKVVVCGGRSFNAIGRLFDFMDGIHNTVPITFVIEGGATGADALAAKWAMQKGIPHAQVRAQWGFYDKTAGPLRNRWMLDLEPDMVIAFPGGSGTADVVKQAEERGILVRKVE